MVKVVNFFFTLLFTLYMTQEPHNVELMVNPRLVQVKILNILKMIGVYS